MELLIICLAKVLDSLLTTSKSILTHRGKKLQASVLVATTQLIFYFLINKIVRDNTTSVMFTVSISAGVGSYIAFIISDRSSTDQLYINIVTSNNKQDMIELCDYLKQVKIKNIISDSYTKDWDRTYTVQILANTRQQSVLLDKFFAKSNNKYLREIID